MFLFVWSSANCKHDVSAIEHVEGEKNGWIGYYYSLILQMLTTIYNDICYCKDIGIVHCFYCGVGI